MSHRSLGCSSKSNIKNAAIVRNVEVPLSKTTKLKITRELEATSSVMTTARSKSSKCSSRSNPLSTGRSTQFVPSELASTAREQLTKKLNFPIDDPIYKGLIPVNVNDSVMHRACPPLNKRAKHRKYLERMKNKKRDPEPDLNDFLSDIKPLHEAYPKYRIDTSVDASLLPRLARDNVDKVTEIMLKLGTLD